MNHGSNKAERYIRTLNDILCKNLSGVGISWAIVCVTIMLGYEFSSISCLLDFLHMRWFTIRPPPDLFNFDFDPEKTGLKIDTKNYLELMKQRKEIMDKIIISRKKYETESKLVREMRKFPDAHGYAIGDLVMIYHETGSVLHSASNKLKRNWIGPLTIQAILDDTHYLVSDWTGQLLPKQIHFNRLKPYVMNLGKINEEGILETATNTRELFKRWKEIKEDSKYDNFLGPIARLMLGTCSSHSKAAAHPCSPIVRHPNCTSLPFMYKHEHSNKRLYHMQAITNKSIAYLYMRHGGSAELASPMVKGIRLVREKEKRKSQGSTHVHSCTIAQEGRNS